MTFEISTSLLDGAGFLRVSVENGDMWYLHLRTHRSGKAMCFGCTSRGPYTATIILLLPNSIKAEPSAFFTTPTCILISRNSSEVRPSVRMPLSSIKFLVWVIVPSPFLIQIPQLSGRLPSDSAVVD